MEGSSPRSALQELLRRGLGERRGLDELTREVWQRRSRLQRENRLDGTLQQVRELLQRAMDAERDALGREDSDDARFREMQLDALPSDTGGAVRELDSYDWRSADAREAYEEIRDLLGREMLDQRFAGMKQAMENATPEDVERIREMLDDLNQLLAAARRRAGHHRAVRRVHGASTASSSRRTRRTPRSWSTCSPQRAAAAQRMLNSMSAEQRAELMELSQQAFGDPRLAQSLAQLDAQLQGLRPGEDWDGQRPVPRRQPDGHGRGHPGDGGARASSTRWPSSSSQSYPGARHGGHRPGRRSAATSATRPASTPGAGRAAARAGAPGPVRAAPPDGSLQLSPEGAAPARRVGAARRGRPDRAAGAASARPAAPARRARPPARPGRGRSATPRPGTCRARCSTPSCAARAATTAPLDVTDVEIVETEQRTRAAVALLRRHVVVDGAGRALGADEAHRAGPAPADLHPVPRRRPEADHLRPARPGGRARASWSAWRAPGSRAPTCTTPCCWPASTCAGTPTPSRWCWSSPTASRPRTWSPTGTHVLRLAARAARRSRATVAELDRLTGAARRRSRSSCSATTRGWPRSSTTSPAAAAAGWWRPTLDGLGAEVVSDYLRTRR